MKGIIQEGLQVCRRDVLDSALEERHPGKVRGMALSSVGVIVESKKRLEPCLLKPEVEPSAAGKEADEAHRPQRYYAASRR